MAAELISQSDCELRRYDSFAFLNYSSYTERVVAKV